MSRRHFIRNTAEHHIVELWYASGQVYVFSVTGCSLLCSWHVYMPTEIEIECILFLFYVFFFLCLSLHWTK